MVKTGLTEEAIKFGIEERKVDEFVLSNKFIIKEYLDYKEIEKRFMQKENGEPFGN